MYVLLTVWVGFISRIGRTRTLRPGDGVCEKPLEFVRMGFMHK